MNRLCLDITGFFPKAFCELAMPCKHSSWVALGRPWGVIILNHALILWYAQKSWNELWLELLRTVCVNCKTNNSWSNSFELFFSLRFGPEGPFGLTKIKPLSSPITYPSCQCHLFSSPSAILTTKPSWIRSSLAKDLFSRSVPKPEVMLQQQLKQPDDFARISATSVRTLINVGSCLVNRSSIMLIFSKIILDPRVVLNNAKLLEDPNSFILDT